MSNLTSENESKILSVKYDYEAREVHELTITKGEQLTLIDGSKNWWKVVNSHSKVGYVPRNFVTCDETSESSKCRVLYDYEPKRNDEIRIRHNDVLVILDKSDDGWWKGEVVNEASRRGWFPSNYVELITHSIEEPINQNHCSEIPVVASISQNIEFVRCLYSFEAKSPEELSFSKGDKLEIINKPIYDPDWYFARRTNGSGDQGLVPKNYLIAFSNETDEIMPAFEHTFTIEQWYYGPLTRDQCDQELNCRGMDGDFLIRDSESNPGDFSISLKSATRNRHFWVHYDNNSKEYQIGNSSFSSMNELIQFYMKNPIYSDEHTNLYLVKPLCK